MDRPDSVRIDATGLHEFTELLLRSAGLSEGAAAGATDVLVRTTLRGVESHGIHALPQYLRQLRDGGANPAAAVRPLSDRGSIVLLDGDGGLGPAVAHEATLRGIERARATGVAVVPVRNANHFGAAGHFALMCAEAQCIGMVMSNTPPIMAATGARTRSIGNSPIGFGAPRLEGPPVVLDIAMSKVAGGKVRLALQNEHDVPVGWILDPEGRPTTNPADFFVHRGALLPMEGHKGYGLALMVETLAGALSGAAMLGSVGNWLYDSASPSGTGYFLLVLDTSAGSAFADTSARVGELCAAIVGSPRAPGVDRILIPGELEHEREQSAVRDGVAISGKHWQALTTLAHEAGLVAQLPTPDP